MLVNLLNSSYPAALIEIFGDKLYTDLEPMLTPTKFSAQQAFHNQQTELAA
jgi:hypothetical protein